MSTFDVGLLTNSYTVTDSLNLANPDDIFSFQISDTRSLKLSLVGLSTPVDLQLKDRIGTILYNGSVNPSSKEAIDFSNLTAGEYSLQISHTSDDTDYTLKIDSVTGLNLESGFFTVGQMGQVGVDYLIDGGGYQGELAIFSLTGMEAFEPGSTAFIKETARRSLTNSTEGYTVIQDATEGAKFSPTFPWGDNQNSGEYKNIKTFTMKPGDTFGFMLVPNGTVQEVFDNPKIGGAKRPLFSLVTANPNEAFHVGQIADVIGDGKTFVMEDKRVDAGSDKDYNDLVFRVTGATGKAVNLDEVIDPGKDWRSEKIGDELRDYINTAPKSLQFTTKSLYKAGEIVNLTDATVYDENGDLMKVDFSLKKQNESEWFALKDAENFTFNQNLASFNYSLDYLLPGSYQIKAIAFDKFGHQSEEVVQDFRINAAPKDLQFSISKDNYEVGETISITGGQVYDADGIDDLVKVDLFLKKDNNDWENITDNVTSFTAGGGGDSSLANFSKDLTVDESGNYQIKGVTYDKAGDVSNVVIYNFTVISKTVEPEPPPPNSPPEQLQFNLLPSYTIGQPVSINDAKVYDQDGENDLTKIELKLSNNGVTIETRNVDIVDDSKGGDGWGTFSYSWSNLVAGNYLLEAKAFDKFNGVSSQISKSFYIISQPPVSISNSPPEQLQLNLLPTYNFGETITFDNAKVYDKNGDTDLDKVTLQWFKDNNFWRNDTVGIGNGGIADNWGSFNISFAGLDLGNYQIKAKAYDKSGAVSNEDTADFKVLPRLNQAPEDLRFSILPLYTNKEIISFSGARVFDADGTNDLEKIDFHLKRSDGMFFDIPDVTQFTTDSKGRARFDYNYDLTGLAPGQYQLWGIAKDKKGNFSNAAFENFALISDPGGDGLSDDVRLAIAESADLGNYTPEELAATREWVVWLTPGKSSAELAANAGAEDLGATKHIPNTYIWKFPEGSGSGDAFKKLGETNGVELAYPQVPVELKLLYQPQDPLFSEQWNLPQTKVPDAWNSVRGRNTTIAVVDDGIAYQHKELQDRYNPLLSWDFSDGDANPTPNSNKTFTQTNQGVTDSGYAYDPVVQRLYITFKQPVNLTGMVTDVNVSFNLKEFLSPDLPLPKDLKVFLYSPNNSAFDPGNWFNSKSSSWWPGKEDLLFEQKVELKIQEDGTVVFDKNKLTGSYAGGDWKLVISNPNPDIYNYYKMYRLSKEIFNSWSLQLQTLNPHGTAVAGVAVASENASGIVGVAPEAQLAGLRLIGNIDQFTGTYKSNGGLIANALFNWNRNQSIDIFNNSWALQYMRRQPLALSAMGLGKIIGRGGLGNNYVFAAGNEGQWGGNVNYNSFANSRHAIAVAAIDNTGVHAPYSTPGASILVSAPSGNGKKDEEYGGVYTTSITTSHGYADDFTGTSAAAPLVSGAIALMLEANPKLTSRDVQHILVKTAQSTDVVRDTLGNIKAGKGWTQNQAGYWFNDKYGFGVIDVDKAVTMAANWTPVEGETVILSGVQNVNEKIPNGNGKLDTSTAKVERDITVEKVEVMLDVEHTNWADLKVVLTSPDGTTSELAKSISNDFASLKYDEKWWAFTSVRHWGESSKGEWKLQVFDEKGNEFKGEWNSWKLNIYGTKPTVNLIVTDPNAAEGGDSGELTITRTGNLKNSLNVNYTTTGSAINGTDYNKITGSVTIPSGANSALIPITVINDAVYEGNENVIVNLAANDVYSLGSEKSATVVIVDNDPVPAPNVVTNTNDSGLGSLRAAIQFTNSNLGKDTIKFNIPTTDPGYNPVTKAFTIRPTSALPTITDPVIIDGTTQFGFAGKPIIELNGSNAGSSYANGLYINAGNSIVQGLAINGFSGQGIYIDSKGSNIIQGNYIGTDVTGTQALGNSLNGIYVAYSSDNIIGGKTAGARNIVSGNGYGVSIYANGTEGNLVQGNYIGTDVTGTQALGNKDGIRIGGSNNIIGGKAAGEGNIIAFNQNGIIVSNGSSGHSWDGIGNAILSNTIFSNSDLGIDLSLYAGGPDGLTVNDSGDNDTGGNKLQNFPVLTSATSNGSTTTIQGTLNSTANTTFRVELFSNSTLDSSSYGEGEKYLGFQNVTTNNSGNASFTLDLPTSVPSGQFITATATDQNNNTSEFSKGILNILANNWNARFINRTAANVSDRTTYDFSNPAAILDLGDQHQGRNDGGLRLYRNWGDGSPTNGVQTDNFAMEAWTRTNFEAGKLYKITTRSDDGIWFRAKNVQTGQWTGGSVVVAGDGADWRDRSTAMPPKTIFFKVPESGEYDFYVQYYEKTGGSIIDINIEEAKLFQDPVNESQRWESTVFWWDRKLGNIPPGDFYNSQNNLIGVVDQGSNTRSDGKKGLKFSDVEYESLNNDERLPDDNYAIRSYTQTNLEAGVKYRAKVLADDGFQLLTKRTNTNQWVYITPKDKWEQAYGGTKVDFEVSQDGLYDMYFNYYEERGNAALDLSWEVVPFNGRLLATTTTNIRSGPGTSYSLVGTIPYDGTSKTVTFDKWTIGEWVDYTAELGTISNQWYRIKGTNQWISAAIVGQKQYLNT